MWAITERAADGPEKWVIQQKAIEIRDHPYFTVAITSMIIIIGVFTGIDSDFTLACERTYERVEGLTPSDDEGSRAQVKECNAGHGPTIVVGDVAQAIFTFEVVVKVLAEDVVSEFFTDKENGSWNILDLVIVIIGSVHCFSFTLDGLVVTLPAFSIFLSQVH